MGNKRPCNVQQVPNRCEECGEFFKFPNHAPVDTKICQCPSKYKKPGIELVAAERKRQIEVEGWDKAHDENHTDFCLSVAGASYALDVAAKHGEITSLAKDFWSRCSDRIWPFDLEWFKPTPKDPVRQLVKAAALIIADIDRIQAKK